MRDGEPADGDASTVETDDRDTLQPVAVTGELGPVAFDERYRTRGSLGHGGMGFVRLVDDEQVGRAVALKVLRPELVRYDEARTRFVKEARIQGQLEHPAVVPVYDLGADPDEAIYFTMKRVRGVTLKEVLAGLATGRGSWRQRFTRRRLLAAFQSVCLALDFAHSRGVLHRDLKPANIMLGDFGEVYLLDWGLARLQGHRDSQPPAVGAMLEPGQTVAGDVLGTPGFMSPEQMRGAHEELSPCSDVYALGALLFEILCLHPLHTGGFDSIMRSTLEGVDARVSARFPDRDVPPELEAVCVKATELAPADRFQSARELHDAVEAYLEGERDLEKRRRLAADHARTAEQWAERAHSGEGIDARRQAMREVGRALALDPDNRAALQAMVELMSRPPEQLPSEVSAELNKSHAEATRWVGRLGAWTYASLLAYIPIVMWVGLRDALYFLPVYVPAALCFALSVYAARARRPREAAMVLAMLLSNVMIAGVWPLMGPLVLLPTIVLLNTVAFAIYLDRRYRPLLIAAGCATVAIPTVLELTGVVSSSYSFGEAGMLIHARAMDLDGTRVVVFLLIVSLMLIVTGTLLASRLRDQQRDAEAHVYLYAWHLREFIPASARPSTDPTYDTRRHRRVTADPAG